MNFHWIRCQVKQKQFKVTWAPGNENFGDAPTKHHPPSHHEKMRPINLYIKGKSPSSLKGCITIMTQTPVTQSKKNIVTATAALSSPMKSITHRISTIVKQLSYKIRLQCLLI